MATKSPRRKNILQSLLLCGLASLSAAYVPPEVKQRWKETQYTMQDAIKIAEECAETGKNSKDKTELFYAVKFLDRYANQNYPTYEAREDLFKRANGSWELRLAVNSDRDEEFYPHPEFRALATAFSTITDNYFGKGIGTKDNGFCFVALGGPSTRDIDRRQVFMNYEDYFINGQQVPGWDLSYYIRGYQRNWMPAERQRPKLAFTVICVTDKMMAVRGSKTGGMAIFRRINADMNKPAFGW